MISMTQKFLAVVTTLAFPLMTLAAESHEYVKTGADVPPGVNQGLITAIVTLIVFVTLVAILTKAAWGPISKGLSDRENKIRKDIQGAEQARGSAEAKLKEYQFSLAKAGDEVRAILDKATADATAAGTRIKMQAQQEAEENKERALRDIEASRVAAVAQIHEQAATLSTAIAEKILRRNLNVDDQRELVRQSLEQLSSTN